MRIWRCKCGRQRFVEDDVVVVVCRGCLVNMDLFIDGCEDYQIKREMYERESKIGD